MITRIRWFIFVGVLCLLAGCSSTEKQGESIKFPPIALFECVNLFDRVIVKRDKSKETEVVFDEASDKAAVSALYALRENIAVGCGAEGSHQLRLIVVGYFTGDVIDSTVKHNAPESSKAVFRMFGWYIKVPFFEYVETPEGEEPPSPKHRDKLVESDFDTPSKPLIRLSNQGDLRYGVGMIDLE